jgi:hypothetical protein
VRRPLPRRPAQHTAHPPKYQKFASTGSSWPPGKLSNAPNIALLSLRSLIMYEIRPINFVVHFILIKVFYYLKGSVVHIHDEYDYMYVRRIVS